MREVKATVKLCRAPGYHTNPRGVSDLDLHRYAKSDAEFIEQRQYYVVTTPPKNLEDVDNLAERFRKLVETWEKETAHLSVTRQQVSRMSFLRIIALGEKILPFIFEVFEKSPASAWPVALEAITGKNPASESTTYREAVQSWLKWGQDHGYWG